MGQTTIYGLPYPELGDLADGPDGFKDLADAIELKLPMLRNTAADSDNLNLVVTTVGEKTIYNAASALVAIGWAEIDVDVDISSPSATIAGYVRIYVNNVQVRSRRFHTQGKSNWVQPNAHAVVPLPKSLASLTVKATVEFDSAAVASDPVVRYRLTEISQYGAPKA